MGARGSTGWDGHHQLQAAQDGLSSGTLAPARALATDQPLRGQALLMLARHDLGAGRLRRALQAGQQALLVFEADGDMASEAATLAVLAQALSGLGRNDEAVEAALLGVRLGDLLPLGPQQSAQQQAQQQALGVACLWARRFDAAEAALHLALGATPADGGGGSAPADAGPTRAAAAPLQLAWLELLRLFDERYFTGQPPDGRVLAQRLARCGGAAAGSPGAAPDTSPGAWGARALLGCWQGRLDAAQADRACLADLAACGPHDGLARPLLHWVQAELAWAQHDLAAARLEAAALVDSASAAEFEQLAFIGHALLGQIYRAQGQDGLALDEERRRRRREQRLQAITLDSRHRVVQAQLDVRASRHSLQQLADRSQELERLSFEDSLTQIANRRCFEQRLSASLGAGLDPQQPLCLALIDLDDFKRINDQHSHAAGDEVLRAVAQAIRSAVRDADLPARFGGDEFVVLFPHTALDTAQRVCERIQAKVSQLSWQHLGAGLRIGASIGVAQARPGDTPAGLVQRSDHAMFQAKHQGLGLAA